MTDDTRSTDAEPAISAAEQRQIVRERYGDIATDSTTCCGDSTDGDSTGNACCADSDGSASGVDATTHLLGYSDDEVDAVEPGANLGLGCGNPTTLVSLCEGQTVLDLGSGAGFDCFLAAEAVGSDGRVIGVDMTPSMVEKARANAAKNDATNVEFRLGEIGHLPVAGESVDVIISNCVINLSPDKRRVFREATRVLKPGGRLAISDIVRTATMPDDVRADSDSLAGCIAGASQISALETMLADAGFIDVSIQPKAESEAFIRDWDPERDVSDYVVSATIEATKPQE